MSRIRQETPQWIPPFNGAIALAQAPFVRGPLLGRFGRILELLFPAVPARRPRLTRPAWVALWNAVAVLAGAGIPVSIALAAAVVGAVAFWAARSGGPRR